MSATLQGETEVTDVGVRGGEAEHTIELARRLASIASAVVVSASQGIPAVVCPDTPDHEVLAAAFGGR